MIRNALAGLPVTDLEAAQQWYEKLLGSSGNRPMDGVVEWSFPNGGGLQLFADPKRAGRASATLVVDDRDREVRRLERDSLTVQNTIESEKVFLAYMFDPDGNQLVLAEAKPGSKLAT